MLLPEAINREWNGQGVIGWAKTRVYEPLKRRCDGKRNTAVSINIVRLQVRNLFLSTFKFHDSFRWSFRRRIPQRPKALERAAACAASAYAYPNLMGWIGRSTLHCEMQLGNERGLTLNPK